MNFAMLFHIVYHNAYWFKLLRYYVLHRFGYGSVPELLAYNLVLGLVRLQCQEALGGGQMNVQNMGI